MQTGGQQLTSSVAGSRTGWLAGPRRLVAAIGPLPIALVLVAIGVAVIQPRFATARNAENIVRQMAVLGILAGGQAFPILSGGLDISVGQVIGFTSLVTGLVMLQFGLLAGIISGILFGGVLGAINGIIISAFRVSPFVVTLGMGSFAYGGALTLTGGQVVFGLPAGFKWLGQGNLGMLPVPFAVAVLGFLTCWALLEKTVFGRYIYAIGGNEEAARLAGVNTRFYKALAYVTNGLLVGLASVVLTARVGSGEPNLGLGSELQALAAVVIGGVALGGGQGSIWGVAMGVLTLSLLSNGLDLLGVSTYTQLMVVGIVIVAATVVDQLRHR
jgi:ribose/xylose/arabinose/galactoside ABC-type transport system permease subunit